MSLCSHAKSIEKGYAFVFLVSCFSRQLVILCSKNELEIVTLLVKLWLVAMRMIFQIRNFHEIPNLQKIQMFNIWIYFVFIFIVCLLIKISTHSIEKQKECLKKQRSRNTQYILSRFYYLVCYSKSTYCTIIFVKYCEELIFHVL